MGKSEESDEFGLSSAAVDAANGEEISGSNANSGGECCGCRCGFLKLRCLLVLFLGVSVFISAVFWLPPFSNLSDRGDSDVDPRYRGHTIVASFKLPKPVSFVEDNVEQLEADIYDNFGVLNSKVAILSTEISGFNFTYIVFVIDPVPKQSIYSADLSIIRSTFESLVARTLEFQKLERVGEPALFGAPSFFEVLKFPGGITVIPNQKTFPLQNVQIQFNFTLNNSILQIQENFEVLSNQLYYGLDLTQNENLHIRLSNSRGSSVAPPAIVQTSVVLRVGVPSQPRLKQLAQTIRDSPARNLGLNNTVFGKVKQVSLSSVLQHSLSGGPTGPYPAPTPAPLPHHHHHHHHHYHHHHHDTYLPPTNAPTHSPVEAPQFVKSAPVPQRSAPSPAKHRLVFPSFAPAPAKSYRASPLGAHPPIKSHQANPPGCRFRFRSTHFPRSPQESPGVVTRAPSMPPQSSVAAPPRPQAKPPTPVVHQISSSSPLPNVIYARVPPPSAIEMDTGPPEKMPSIAPSPSAGGHIPATSWVSYTPRTWLYHHPLLKRERAKLAENVKWE